MPDQKFAELDPVIASYYERARRRFAWNKGLLDWSSPAPSSWSTALRRCPLPWYLTWAGGLARTRSRWRHEAMQCT